MLAEKSIIRFKNKKGVEMIGIITDARIYNGEEEYSVFPGESMPKLTPDSSESPWFYTANNEDILEVIKNVAPKSKKKADESDESEEVSE